MRFFQQGHAEAIKVFVHRGMKVGAGLCLGYNAVAWLLRREPHLATNVVVYGLLYALEDAHVRSHQDQRVDESAW